MTPVNVCICELSVCLSLTAMLAIMGKLSKENVRSRLGLFRVLAEPIA